MRTQSQGENILKPYLITTLIILIAIQGQVKATTPAPEASKQKNEMKGLNEHQAKTAHEVMDMIRCTDGSGLTISDCIHENPNCAHSVLLSKLIVRHAARGYAKSRIIKATMKASSRREQATKPLTKQALALLNRRTALQLELNGAPVKGPTDASVTIIEISDYQCPYCKKGANTMARIQESYPEQVRIAFKNNPLPFHAAATGAAELAMVAGEQGRYWEMHDLLYENQADLSELALQRYATELGIKEKKLSTELEQYRDYVEHDRQTVTELGMNGTPAYLINGRYISGAQPYATFKAIVEQEIRWATSANRPDFKIVDHVEKL